MVNTQLWQGRENMDKESYWECLAATPALKCAISSIVNLSSKPFKATLSSRRACRKFYSVLSLQAGMWWYFRSAKCQQLYLKALANKSPWQATVCFLSRTYDPVKGLPYVQEWLDLIQWGIQGRLQQRLTRGRYPKKDHHLWSSLNVFKLECSRAYMLWYCTLFARLASSCLRATWSKASSSFLALCTLSKTSQRNCLTPHICKFSLYKRMTHKQDSCPSIHSHVKESYSRKDLHRQTIFAMLIACHMLVNGIFDCMTFITSMQTVNN